MFAAAIAGGILNPFELPMVEANGRPAPKDDPPAAPAAEILFVGVALDAPNVLSCLIALENGRAGAVVLIPVVVAAEVVAPNPVSPVKPPKGFEDTAAGVVCGRGVVIGKAPPKGPAANPANGLFDDAVSDINEEVASPPVERLGRTIFLLASSSCDALATNHSGR